VAGGTFIVCRDPPDVKRRTCFGSGEFEQFMSFAKL
jgi:hypothetical protein